MEAFTSTIAALATPPGKGGVAMLRVSGEQAVSVAQKVFFPRGTGPLSEIAPRTAVYGDVVYRGERIDDAVAVVYRAPHSYTGEDTVEISCHGSEIGASLVLSALFAAGAVPAAPGEYTKRAFLNGKLDLSQAEAVGELIDAQSVAALKLSGAKLRGKLSQKIDALASDILDILTAVYAYIDYPDEDIADMSAGEMRERTQAVLTQVCALLETYDAGRAVSHGIPAAIVGAPNVGKSSFFNCLCGEQRAIVTEIAGTTRDVVTAEAAFGNIRLLLHDTAGIRGTDDPVETLGVERSLRELREAPLIFLLLDASRPLSAQDGEILKTVRPFVGEKHVIAVLNKQDAALPSLDATYGALAEAGIPACDVLRFCAKDGSGRDALEQILSRLYPAGDDAIRSGLIVTGARQFASLKKAQESLSSALAALETLTPDMCCNDLETALGALYEIDGRRVNDKIIDGIFSRFCVGK